MPSRRDSTVTWAPSADRDLGRIQDFFQSRSPRAFRGLARRLLAAADRLARFPESGLVDVAFPPPGRFRYVVVAPYRLFYSAAAGTVRILRVWDSRRDSADLRVGDVPDETDGAEAGSGPTSQRDPGQGGSE